MIHRKQESLLPPDLLQLLLKPLSDTTEALFRLDERIARLSVGAGWCERQNFSDACASLWIDGALVNLADLVLYDVTRDVRAPTHDPTIARDVLENPPHNRSTGHCRQTAYAVCSRPASPRKIISPMSLPSSKPFPLIGAAIAIAKSS